MDLNSAPHFCPNCGTPLAVNLHAARVSCGVCGMEFVVHAGVSGPLLIRAADVSSLDGAETPTKEQVLRRLQTELDALNQAYESARARYHAAQDFITRSREDLKTSQQNEKLHKTGSIILAFAILLLVVGIVLIVTSKDMIALETTGIAWLILFCLAVMIGGVAFVLIKVGENSPRRIPKPGVICQQIFDAEHDIYVAHVAMGQFSSEIQAKIEEINVFQNRNPEK